MSLGFTQTIDSWYLASAGLASPRPPLAGDCLCDVAIVGAGLAGTSAALHLAQRGYRVVVLEGARVGYGASGRSGAQLLPGFASGQAKLEPALGRDGAKLAFALTVEGLDLARQLIRDHAIDCDFRSGQATVAIKPRQVRELLDWQMELEHLGYAHTRLVDRDELRSLLATERYLAGVFDANAAHVHPLKYVRGLAAAAERAGAVLHEGTPVLRIEAATQASGLSRLHTATGIVSARHVALCGNAYLQGALPAIRDRIMPVGTYIVATEPLGERLATDLIRNDMAVTDCNFVLDYFRRSADHRLLFGGRVSYSGYDPLGTARATRARMLKVYPQLASARIEHAWGGYVDITMSRAPDFNRIAPGVFYAQGFSGHGMALAPLAGKLMAEAIAGQAERFDLFARLKHRPFPGGAALRRPALVLAMLWFRLRDWL
ncbi:MAG: NAD(P)/FAD-dependent oxidoreductase [Gammaproteobacteria bacterium]